MTTDLCVSMRTVTLQVTRFGNDAGLVFFRPRCTNRDFGHVRVHISQSFSNLQQTFYVMNMRVVFCVERMVKTQFPLSVDPSAKHRTRTRTDFLSALSPSLTRLISKGWLFTHIFVVFFHRQQYALTNCLTFKGFSR